MHGRLPCAFFRIGQHWSSNALDLSQASGRSAYRADPRVRLEAVRAAFQIKVAEQARPILFIASLSVGGWMMNASFELCPRSARDLQSVWEPVFKSPNKPNKYEKREYGGSAPVDDARY